MDVSAFFRVFYITARDRAMPMPPPSFVVVHASCAIGSNINCWMHGLVLGLAGDQYHRSSVTLIGARWVWGRFSNWSMLMPPPPLPVAVGHATFVLGSNNNSWVHGLVLVIAGCRYRLRTVTSYRIWVCVRSTNRAMCVLPHPPPQTPFFSFRSTHVSNTQKALFRMNIPPGVHMWRTKMGKPVVEQLLRTSAYMLPGRGGCLYGWGVEATTVREMLGHATSATGPMGI